jgi:hypothetical protein
MPEDKDTSPGFKVVDRRGFSSDGTRREEGASGVNSVHVQPAGAPETPAMQAAEFDESADLGPPDFETIVSYLSTTAFFQLGLLAGPGGQRIPPDLVNARRTIDMLEVLQLKTRGNLSSDENQMLDDALYELRMTFVEVQKRLTQPPR